MRHLIAHTAGFARNPANRRNQRVDGPIDPGVSDVYNLPDVCRALATTTLTHAPGTVMEYSNYACALLGYVVERVSDTPYEQVIRTRLLTPLGMRESGITMTSAQSQRLAASYWAEDESRTKQSIHARYGDVVGFIGMTGAVPDGADGSDGQSFCRMSASHWRRSPLSRSADG